MSISIIKSVDWAPFSFEQTPGTDSISIFRISARDYYSKISENVTNVLSAEELFRSSRFFNKTDQERFISARYALRNLLSVFLLQKASDIQFKLLENNKPEVEGIEFNISHSQNEILIAIGTVSLGIDVEYIDPQFDMNMMLDSILTQQEADFVRSYEEKHLGFYTMWTRKEALLKATGEGLIDDLSCLSVLQNVVSRKGTHYNLVSFLAGHQYSGAISYPNQDPKTIKYFNYP
ncbi:4'-phosphopantetheinyl transferase family protein [Pedobacter nutrimenti]|uniref:4'-phosphopantetheinyl transferase n=1 Tax=Pedobacter nutrimenti TaxID=1241337 RepID=A0A318UZ60_9SPHI|nr:4'-phosphopantetheinyl transferase superfamily protein [Pedobacter nutrimenti]PYF76879.1 4'-phosphopantetheinyl transferase [Pedobacter nutrimenti]